MTNKKAKKYLVTGGAGFIGSFLCQRLAEKNQTVVCVDNLSTGKKQNIAPLLNKKNFTFVKADVTKIEDFKEIPDLDYDFVLHLASPAGPNPKSPKSYHQLWQETYLVNSYGTHLLCQLAQKSRAVFLFASSSEVYGDPEIHPQKEGYFGHVNPIGPRAIYDESKRLGEAITANFSRHTQLKTRIVRIFNTYGPRMNVDDGRALTLFIHQAIKRKPITVYGTGKQTRSFCFIDDQVEGILKLIDCEKCNAVPVNIGNTQEITINQLLKKIKEILGELPTIQYLPLPEDDPQRRKPDITLAKKLLNWQPKISLDEGLRRTIDYFQKK